MPIKVSSPNLIKNQPLGVSKGGRKELAAAEKRTRRIVLRFTEADFAEIEAQATQSGRPLAVLIRARLAGKTPGNSWTAEQFRLCRMLGSLHGELCELAEKSKEKADSATEAASKLRQSG
jgi:hypothetical protein